MAIEPIMRPGSLPAINRERVKARGPDEIIDYLLKLVRALEDNVLGQLVQTMNLFLQLFNEGVFYFQLPDANGAFVSGAMRLKKETDGSIQLQEYDGTTWNIVWQADY